MLLSGDGVPGYQPIARLFCWMRGSFDFVLGVVIIAASGIIEYETFGAGCNSRPAVRLAQTKPATGETICFAADLV